MITTRYALCGVRVIRDAEDNRISIVDIFEDIGSPQFPVLIPRASFVWALSRDEGDEQVHNAAIVVTQGGQELGRFEMQVDFKDALLTRIIAVVGGLVIPEPGPVVVRFDIPDVATATFLITARAIQQVVAQQAEPGRPVPPGSIVAI